MVLDPVNHMERFGAMVLLLSLAASSSSVSGAETDDFIEVKNPKAIGVDRLAAERIPIGIKDDYKPCVARLPDGELLLIGFNAPQGKPLDAEYSFLYRSRDGGRTWSKRQDLDFIGREPYFSVTPSGVVFVTTHVLPAARGSTESYCYCQLYRSDDGAKTWTETKIPFDDAMRAARRDGKRPETANTGTARNVLELDDGTFIFGVGSGHGAALIWQSSDEGRSWDKTLAGQYSSPDIGKYPGSIHNEAFMFLASNGDVLSIKRVIPEYFPVIPGSKDTPHGHNDQFHRLVVYRSSDRGASWSFEEFDSWYGEMYPSVLRLQDGRLLFTYTQRTSVPPNTPPLGLRAAIGEQTPDGFRFDFKHDRIMLDTKTPANLTSGGSFGPTVQNDDGTLVSSYSYRKADNSLHCEVVRWKLPSRSKRK